MLNTQENFSWTIGGVMERRCALLPLRNAPQPTSCVGYQARHKAFKPVCVELELFSDQLARSSASRAGHAAAVDDMSYITRGHAPHLPSVHQGDTDEYGMQLFIDVGSMS